MQILLFIGLVIIVIILVREGVPSGIISALVTFALAFIAGVGTAAISSFIVTPFLGVPLGIFVFSYILKRMR